MKPICFKSRSLSGMKLRLIAVVVPLLLFSSMIRAQEGTIQRLGGSRYEMTPQTIKLPSRAYTNLSFTGSSYMNGKLTIISSNVSGTTITYRKTMKAESTQQAEEYADFVEVNYEELENELSISAETKAVPPWSGTNWSGGATVEIAVPKNENLKIDVRTSAFSIDIIGPFAAVDITNSLGDVSIEKISSKVRVSLENGAVNVSDCTGPTTISTALRPITLTRVDGKLGSIKLRNTNAKIALESVRGEIDARCDNAMISGNNVSFESGHSLLATGNSNIDIEAEAINGDLTIRGANGTIDLTVPTNSSATYLLQVEEGGRIYTRNLPMTVNVASRTRVVGTAGAKRNKIEVDMSGVGTVNLEGKSATRTSLR
jgi:hypothetical protein